MASAALQMKSRKMSECEWIQRWPALVKWKHRPTDRRKWWRAFFRVQKEKYFYIEEAKKKNYKQLRHQQQQQQHIVTVVTVWLCDWMKETNHLLRVFFICFIIIVVVAVLYFHFKFCWMPLLSWPTCLSCARIHPFTKFDRLVTHSPVIFQRWISSKWCTAMCEFFFFIFFAIIMLLMLLLFCLFLFISDVKRRIL